MAHLRQVFFIFTLSLTESVKEPFLLLLCQLTAVLLFSNVSPVVIISVHKGKGKSVRYRPEVAQRVPGS